MPHHIPPTIFASQIPGKGKGLFTSQAIEAGNLVFSIDHPLVCVPDNDHLNTICYNCFSDDGTRKLKSCMGCKVVRYCSQALSQQYPNIPPSVPRIVMQLLLRRRAGALTETEWIDFLSLQTHLDDFRRNDLEDNGGVTRLQDVIMMSHAAWKFSAVNETSDFVESVTTRTIINSMTASNAALDPLGTCLSTYASQLNHSCDPNCIFTFSGRSLSVRSLQAIPAGGELTISYVDISMSRSERQKKLKSSYYFECACSYCSASLTCGQPDIPESLRVKMSNDEILRLEKEGNRLQALAADAAPEKKAGILDQAVDLFRPYKDIYPIWRYPWPLINYTVELVCIDQGHWLMAFARALKAYFYTEPVHYPLTWHPVRTVRTFVLLKIIFELGYQANQGPDSEQYSAALAKYNIHFPAVIAALVDEIDAAIPNGFGTYSSFAAQFRPCREGTLSQRPHMEKDAWEKERVKLRRLADELVN
ncbi:MAG: hypothetical protein Q9179_000617 [Wetmoreana sp. 5 TL-2023]